LRGHHVPFTTLINEPEALDPEVLRSRYHGALEALFRLWGERRS
jgi:hypothetical protein